MKPLPYQEWASDIVAASTLAIYNVFDPGLGKSCTALEVAKKIKARRVLITGPLTATYSWRLELEKFWPEHPPFKIVRSSSDVKEGDGVFYVTYGLLSRSASIVGLFRVGKTFDLSILDEAHALKNSGAARTKAVLSTRTGFRDKLGRAHPMSATPAPNHAGELWPVLASLRPDLIKDADGRTMSKDRFEERYCKIEHIKVQGGRQQRVITGSKNVPELRQRLNGFFLRKTKAEVLKDLPPLRFVTHPVQIDNPEYFQTLSQLVESGITDEEVLRHAEMMANSTRYAELGMAKAPQGAELVRDLLDGGMGQIAVWAIHTPVIDHLVTHLADFGVSRLDGGVSGSKRDEGIKAFVAGQHRVFVGQIEAGGTAITLSGGALKCSDALFVESHFSPKLNWQAACRIHRIGQHDAVLARFLSAVGTYDERLQDIQARKTQDFADLFDHEENL